MRSRTARVMTTLMRNGRDRRSENPFWADAIARVPGWDRSADHIRASGHCGCIATEAILQAKIGRIHGCTRTLRRKVRFLLHRGRRPYMALFRQIAALHHFGRKRGAADKQRPSARYSSVAIDVVDGARSQQRGTGAARYWRSSRRCRRALSAWKRAPPPIIGRVNSRSLVTRFV